MIGIKKRKIVIWKSVYYMDLQLAPFQRKPHQNFYGPTHLSIFQCVGTPDDAINNQPIFDFCLRVLKHVVCYRCHSVLYTGFRPLKVIVSDVVDEILRI